MKWAASCYNDNGVVIWSHKGARKRVLQSIRVEDRAYANRRRRGNKGYPFRDYKNLLRSQIELE